MCLKLVVVVNQLLIPQNPWVQSRDQSKEDGSDPRKILRFFWIKRIKKKKNTFLKFYNQANV